MTTANVSQGSAYALPPVLEKAQKAIHLPEVQEMLRRLAKHELGIFMPHQHDELTGDFHPLAAEVMQVESGCRITFQRSEEIKKQADRFLQVAWFWRADASAPVAACEMILEVERGAKGRLTKHKMPSGD